MICAASDIAKRTRQRDAIKHIRNTANRVTIGGAGGDSIKCWRSIDMRKGAVDPNPAKAFLTPHCDRAAWACDSHHDLKVCIACNGRFAPHSAKNQNFGTREIGRNRDAVLAEPCDHIFGPYWQKCGQINQDCDKHSHRPTPAW